MNKVVFLSLLFLAGCVFVQPLTEQEKAQLENPSQETLVRIDKILDEAVLFVRKSETEVLSDGRGLNPEEIEYASKLGINQPERIRIKYARKFPIPENNALLKEFKELGFGSWFEGGRTNGYGIFIKPRFAKNKSIIEHELVHVLQMQRMGLQAFLKQYLIEAMTVNYFNMPLEVEAFEKTEGDKF